MTETEWLVGAEPDLLLTFLHRTASARKTRLFACACCRRIEHLLSFPDFIQAVEVSERFADSQATDDERQSAHKVVDDYNWSSTPEHGHFRYSDWAVAEASNNWPVHVRHPIESARNAAKSARTAMERDSAYRVRLAGGPPEPEATFPFIGERVAAFKRAAEIRWEFEKAEEHRLHAEEASRQVAFLRDIFGNLFRPVALDPAWLTSTVVALAEGVYQDRAFDRMPILADALQDTGCDSDDVLNHCRDTTLTHVRGCWVIDLLTGRK